MHPDHTDTIESIEINENTGNLVSVTFDHRQCYGGGVWVTRYYRTYRLKECAPEQAEYGSLQFAERTKRYLYGVLDDESSQGPLPMAPQLPGESFLDRVIRDLRGDFWEDTAAPLIKALRAEA